jgi:N-acetylmuramoyl-L-alanine amidase
MRTINRIVVHHSASPKASTTAKLIDLWHRAKKYLRIGYHRVIKAGGVLELGRPDDQVGAHALGFNTGSLGVCLTGNFEKEQPDAAQIDTLVQVLATWCLRYRIHVDRIVGHYKLNPTSCPGKYLIVLLPVIRRRVAAYLPPSLGGTKPAAAAA